jgi:hypothetical protein
MGASSAFRALLLAFSAFASLLASDAPASAAPEPSRSQRAAVETPLSRVEPAPRVAAWAEHLPPVEIVGVNARLVANVRLYRDDGEIDEDARDEFERVASGDAEPHRLAVRVEQLVLRAAYHFKATQVVIVSAWRANAGRHGTGEAIDFKLRGVRASLLAAYLRGTPRAGVGVYTHPRTQFVHLDVREASYHWIDASPPGVKWREGQLRDTKATKRDAAWTPEMDLPF